MNVDLIRQQWETEYPGQTDNGVELPISQVVPGVLVNSLPVGYFPAKDAAQVENDWEWKWES